MPEQDNTTVSDTEPTPTTVAIRDREAVATVDDDGAIVIPTHIDGLPLKFSREQNVLNREQMRILGPLGIEANYDLGEVIAFLIECRKRGFDPYAKEAMLYKIAGKYIRHIGIEGLRRKAEESGEYRGQAPPMFCGPDGLWRDIWTSSEPPLACKVGVYRAGFVEAVSRPVFWDEYCPMGPETEERNGRQVKTGRKVPLANWKPAGQGGKPLVMLVKVAEAAALRAAWPNRFNGWYIPEETAKMRTDTDQQTDEAKQAAAERDGARERRKAAFEKANPPAARPKVIDSTAVDTTAVDDGQREQWARTELAWQADTLGRTLEWITRRWRAARDGRDFDTATCAEAVDMVLRYRPIVVEHLRKSGQGALADTYAAAGTSMAPLDELIAAATGDAE